MDYNYIIEKTYRKASFFIIKKFKEFYNEGRPFSHSIDKIRIYLCNNQIYKNNVGNNLRTFESCYSYFNHHEDYYKKGTSIDTIIENEIKKEFENINPDRILLDRKGSQIENYTFNKFIYDLIVYDTLKRIESRLRINNELYRLYFDFNNYNDFTLKAFDGHVINSDLYKKLYSKFYPNKTIPIAIERKDEFNNIVYEIINNNNELSGTKNKNKTQSKLNKQKFELDEQLLILNLCLEDRNSIPLTEKAKLIILIGEIIDDNLFNVSSSNSNTYAKISKGIYRKGSAKNMIEIIAMILIKIETFNLKITNETLRRYQATLKNEQKNEK